MLIIPLSTRHPTMAPYHEAAGSSSPGVGFLYDQYAPAVFGYIMSIIPHSTKAEMILIEVFCKYSGEPASFPHQAGRLLGLINCCRNHCIRQLLQDHQHSMSSTCKEYVQSLPPLEKTIFVLLNFGGLTINKIASLLGLTAGRIENIGRGLRNINRSDD